MNKEILENMPTSELDEVLKAELRREVPDGDIVREILQILEEREEGQPIDITPELQAAWDKFNAETQRRADRPRPTARSWVIRVTSIAAILCLLICVIPMEAQAENWWEKLTRWTDTVLEFFVSTEATEPHAEYEFKTDNPGLQKVHDAVVELGVTEPVVPMWIPDGYELYDIETASLDNKTNLAAIFTDGEDDLIFKVSVLKLNNWHEYHKSDERNSVYEYGNVKHHIMQNNNRWKTVWEKERIECFISFAGEEEDIYKIIQSIY